MRHLSILAAAAAASLAALPAAAHVGEGPHVHGDQVGALMVGLAIIVAAGGVAAIRLRAGKRRK
ncbi:MAG: hypothetical protein EP307_12135 [Rhodobacteraceae bacterium]|nr:MAG: hypothetical protein EP307_12135 [Paracoccaceae bacterium]